MQTQNNQSKFDLFRTQFPAFVYQGFNYKFEGDFFKISFDFSIDGLSTFSPEIKFVNADFLHFNSLSKSELDNLIFHMGMVELISYWKTSCAPKVIIKSFYLDEVQIKFWKKLYYNGLGEFFYLNGIQSSEHDFMNIEVDSTSPKLLPFHLHLDQGALIPVGGGKDSVVSLEILRGKSENLALIINPRGASIATANVGGYQQKTIEIKRSIDSNLLNLNAKGYLNGHTPFSAMLAFTTLLAAAFTGKKNIALSNESSANESTVKDSHVNHQYSKSIEFETDFRNYYKKYISPDFEYYSLLRPLSELQIASLFAQHPKYFGHFKSCNVGSKNNVWCGHCPKCLFTFIILSPFLEPEVLESIFGYNMLNNIELLHEFKELLGMTDEKPFECVGTIEEVQVALCMTLPKYTAKPILLNYFQEHFSNYKCESTLISSLLKHLDEPHFLNAEALLWVKKALKI